MQQYFRTYDNENIIYKFQKDTLGNKSSYDDTLTCRILVRRGVFWKQYDKNFDLFYFEKANLPNSPKTESPFYNFTSCFVKGNLYVGQNQGTFSNPMSYSNMKLLIPSKIKKGDSFLFTGSDYKSVFTFIGFDDFKWHLPIQKCLKFSIVEGYSQKTTYIWLTKKWGIVKWIKPNGEEGIMYE